MKYYYWGACLLIIFLLNACDNKYPSCDTFDCVKQHPNDTLLLIGTYIHSPQEPRDQLFLRLSDGVELEMTMVDWAIVDDFSEQDNGLKVRVKGIVYLTTGGSLLHFWVREVEWLEPFF